MERQPPPPGRGLSAFGTLVHGAAQSWTGGPPMADATRVVLVDDIDGTEGAETVTFAYRGVSYELDLAPANAARLDEALRPFVAAARRAADRSASREQSRQRRAKSSEIRDWARRRGIKVSTYGRIPADVIKRYEEDQGS